MPTLRPESTYDIFISYRHKDNKYDGWVTQFVNDLRKELEATFKEDVSIYFDENPHDGLRETHDVDESLREKLKCLILIPIISQTYCDPNSFAWKHEFLFFKELAETDELGLKVRLANGNVASRILPIRIHYLDPEDQTLLENEIGPLRSVDFIFSSAGVNRPLTSSDDRTLNLNKTFYRDQVNKVANAVKEIVQGIRAHTKSEQTHIPVALQPEHTFERRYRFTSRKTYLGVSLAAILMLAAYFSLFKSTPPLKEQYVSIAVLPFYTAGGTDSSNPYGVGIASEIRARLAESKKFEFISSMEASLPFAVRTLSPKAIGQELGVDYLLSGLYQLAGDRIRVDVELVEVVSGRSVWNLTFNELFTDIFEIQSNIARKVFGEFGFQETDESLLPTQNMDAYKKYLKALELSKLSWQGDSAKTAEGLALLEETILDDPTFIDAYLSWINLTTWWWWTTKQSGNEQLLAKNSYIRNAMYEKLSQARRFAPDSWKLVMMEAIIKYRVEHRFDDAEQLFLRYLPYDPDNALAHIILGGGIYKRKLMQKEAIRHLLKANQINRRAARHWDEMAAVFTSMGDYQSAYEVLKHETSTVGKLYMLQQGYDIPELAEIVPDHYKIHKKFHERDYMSALALRDSLEKNRQGEALFQDSYLWRTILYHLLEEKDSANYYADRFLVTHPSPDQSTYGALILSIKGDQKRVLQVMDNVLRDFDGQDYLRHCNNMVQRILMLAILKDYKEATQMLIKLNKDFPTYGDYLLLQTNPLLDKIKSEYPPFAETVNNLKLPPKIDWKGKL